MVKLVCVADYEAEVKKRLPKSVYDYYRSGADEENTLRENRNSFKRCKDKLTWINIHTFSFRYLIRPLMLRDVSNYDFSVTLNIDGQKLACPIGIAPTASQRLAHDHGEIAMAKGVCVCVFIYKCLTLNSRRAYEHTNDCEYNCNNKSGGCCQCCATC
jgi:(S)-2-hydroxy-acid oxidase